MSSAASSRTASRTATATLEVVWPSTPTPMSWAPDPVSSTASSCSRGSSTGRRGPPSPARGRRRQLTQRNRLWSVTDAFQPAVHRPGRRGIELRPGTRTDRRGTHQPGWEGIALRSYVRSIDPVEGRKIIGRAPLIVTPIRMPTALWAGHLMRELGPRMPTPWATTATRSAECLR
jgi:hypothetical protein